MDNINKLRLTSFAEPTSDVFSILKTVGQAAARIFELQINPEQYNRNFKIVVKKPEEQGATNNSKESQFKNVEQETLDLKFTIDGTGIIPIQQPAIDLVSQGFSAIGKDAQLEFVTAKIAQLKLVVYGIEEESHSPPFILVNWGKLVFLGVLTEMTQNFTLFHQSGLPLRVEVNLKIQEFIPKNKLGFAQPLFSPDLTKKRTVKSSDNILSLTNTVYDKPDNYLEVAKANQLTNFRKLQIGSELVFPPIK